MKVVYNTCYGGFSLSHKAQQRYTELTGNHLDVHCGDDLDRWDPALVQVVEELGPEANGSHAELAICEVPAGTKWRLEEYDGKEWVMPMDSYLWHTAT